MEITNEVLINLNQFRNKMIVRVQETESNNEEESIELLKSIFDDFKIELFSSTINKDNLSVILLKLASNCFIFYTQINKDK